MCWFGQRENVKCFVIMHGQMGLGSSRVERVHKNALSPSNFREEINESNSEGDEQDGEQKQLTAVSVWEGIGRELKGTEGNTTNNRFLAQLFKWALSAGSQRGNGAAE